MARTAYFDGYSFGAVDQSAKTQVVSFTCSWADNSATDDHVRIGFMVGTSNPPSGTIYWYDTGSGKSPGYWRDWPNTGPETCAYDGVAVGSLQRGPELVCDTTHYVNSRINYFLDYAESTVNSRTSSTTSLKTYAIDPTIGTPTLSGETSTSVTVDGTWTPGTVESTATVYVQYKAASSGTWLTWGSSSGSGTGYTSRAITQTTITGLSGSTSYNFRLYVDRPTTTNSTKTFNGSTATTSTTASTPEISNVTTANLGETSVSLVATFDANGKTSADYRFVWGTSAGVYTNSTSWTDIDPNDTPTETSEPISVSANTTYYFRAEIRYDGPSYSYVYSAEETFTTPVAQAQQALDKGDMRVLYFDRKYGVTTDGSAQGKLTFTLEDVSANSSNTFVAGVSFAAGDVTISKDGGALANTTNLPAQIGSSALYSLVLTAAEMQAAEIDILIIDQTATEVWRDTLLKVRTKQYLGQIIVDASQVSNGTAVDLTGAGTGYGWKATGGTAGKDVYGHLVQNILNAGTAQAGAASSITLATNAVATADYYNEAQVTIISGTGLGQTRTITDYSAARVATVSRAWATTPDATSVYVVTPGADVWDQVEQGGGAAYGGEPTATANDLTFRRILQLLKRRFFNKATQTATTQTLFRDDSSTTLLTATVSDDGTTQTRLKHS